LPTLLKPIRRDATNKIHTKSKAIITDQMRDNRRVLPKTCHSLGVAVLTHWRSRRAAETSSNGMGTELPHARKGFIGAPAASLGSSKIRICVLRQ
jgi:hypothetical protein